MGIQGTLARWASLLRNGMQFGGARDLYAVFGYNRNPVHKDYVTKYLTQDIATRVINAPVDATWTDAPVLKINGAPWKEWNDLVESTNLYAYLRKADIFAGLGIYSIMLIGLDDGRSLDQPVNTNRRNKVIYLQPYLEGSLKILQYEVDQTSPRFGKPILYQVQPGDPFQETSSATAGIITRKSFNVHHSRVLHLADNSLEDGVFGHSRLKNVYNTLDDLLKVCGGSAETYWLTANRGMQVDVDKEMELDDEDQKNLSEELDEYMHQLRRVIRTRGVKIQSLGSDVADPKNVFAVLIALLSAATGIPQRVLMGAEAGQLASQQDRANWAARVAERIANWAEPIVLRQLIDVLVRANVLEAPSNLEILWPDPFKMNPLERAQTSAQMARSAVNIARAMQVAQECKFDVLSIEEARNLIAPDDKMPVFTGLPVGKLPPPIEEVDPNKFLPPESAVSPEQENAEEESGTGTTPERR